jgi:REP element-mobilizing transposase RayT
MKGMQEKHRRSIRLGGYDYRAAGGYFITVCTVNKRCVFGKIENDVLLLNVYGCIVAEEWKRTEELRANVILDEWIVMPNHFHGILLFRNNAFGGKAGQTLQANSLGAILGQFKSVVTKRINTYREERGLSKVQVWQRNYYERIIRDEKELNETRRYIGENPLNWKTDKNYK